ncbi:MAG: nucleotidyl transferase AbiEii/AbiGii toxin family protein [Sulfuritalea sp.]|nr:nucleotidyl transferase AbiEii/AbiGii toxin family protein [Sulfuritalea sp.]MDP1984900.1 nucleotidyl transferase AbiEii/AbiGii toxin family protein [Sulfuritalea sp.]
MTAISRPLTPRSDRPVEPVALSVIQEIHKASKTLGLPVFLVGAMARIILLENVHGLPPGRATTDVDFAFALDNWDQFTAIKAFLLSNANFEESKHVVHRLHFHPEGFEHQYKVDLIPFGGIETSANTIAWPPDMAVMMNVAGFGDALAAAVNVEVSPRIEIAVASLPGIAILKLFAWADRGQENPKDAIDLILLLRNYGDAGNASRIYGEASALAALEAVGYDLELAGAWLLGSDAASMVSAPTNADLEALLRGPKREKLAEDMAGAMLGRHDALEYSHRLLEQFTKGFTA